MAKIDAELLLHAYASGLFPMALDGDADEGADGDGEGGSDRAEIGWFSPDPRGVIPLDEFHIPHGLKRVLRKQPFEMRVNGDFPAVISGCANRSETWISADILESYIELHKQGFAHSVESWRGDKLVGGLYGVSLGGAFFGESMFSLEPEASKVALVTLVERMRERGLTLLDTQWSNDHLTQFGCREIPRDEYLEQLSEALLSSVSFVDG